MSRREKRKRGRQQQPAETSAAAEVFDCKKGKWHPEIGSRFSEGSAGPDIGRKVIGGHNIKSGPSRRRPAGQECAQPNIGRYSRTEQNNRDGRRKNDEAIARTGHGGDRRGQVIWNWTVKVERRGTKSPEQV